MAMTSMLTTTDNPFDPFDQWDEWYAWDTKAGYHTCGFLARITKSSDELSEADQEFAIESAMREIVQYDILGVYVIVTKEVDMNNQPSFLLARDTGESV